MAPFSRPGPTDTVFGVRHSGVMPRLLGGGVAFSSVVPISRTRPEALRRAQASAPTGSGEFTWPREHLGRCAAVRTRWEGRLAGPPLGGVQWKDAWQAACTPRTGSGLHSREPGTAAATAHVVPGSRALPADPGKVRKGRRLDGLTGPASFRPRVGAGGANGCSSCSELRWPLSTNLVRRGRPRGPSYAVTPWCWRPRRAGSSCC